MAKRKPLLPAATARVAGIGRYIYDKRPGSTGRYRDRRTGRFIAQESVIGLLEERVTHFSEQSRILSNSYGDGRLSLAQWERGQRQLMKRLHIQKAALGAGGFKQLDLKDVNARLADQNKRFDKFMLDIRDKALSPAQMRARAQLYVKAGRSSYWDERTKDRAGAGDKEEKWITVGDGIVCDLCSGLGEMGWQPIGVLPNPGQRCRGLTNCRCEKKYRKADGVTLAAPLKAGAPSPVPPDLTGKPKAAVSKRRMPSTVATKRPRRDPITGRQAKVRYTDTASEKSLGRIVDSVRTLHSFPADSGTVSYRVAKSKHPDGFYGLYSPDTKLVTMYPGNTAQKRHYLYHETGHHVDFGILEYSRLAETTGTKRNLSAKLVSAKNALRKAIDSSDAVTRLRETNRTGMDGTRKADRRYVSYLATDEETFARAYAQYATEQLGDSIAKKSVDAERLGHDSYTAWKDADFVPISKAFDRVFREVDAGGSTAGKKTRKRDGSKPRRRVEGLAGKPTPPVTGDAELDAARDEILAGGKDYRAGVKAGDKAARTKALARERTGRKEHERLARSKGDRIALKAEREHFEREAARLKKKSDASLDAKDIKAAFRAESVAEAARDAEDDASEMLFKKRKADRLEAEEEAAELRRSTGLRPNLPTRRKRPQPGNRRPRKFSTPRSGTSIRLGAYCLRSRPKRPKRPSVQKSWLRSALPGCWMLLKPTVSQKSTG